MTIRNPVAPYVEHEGTGLCMASAQSTAPGNDFGGATQPGTYIGTLNMFLEARKDERVEYVIRTLLDLSNNNGGGTRASYGDFLSAMLPECGIGGCDFAFSSGAYASRLRGFFNVTPELVNQPIHFGFYIDDSVSLVFYNRTGGIFPVVLRQVTTFFPTWRVTKAVIFQEPGLYPLELLHVEGGEHAALEMSYFIGAFDDFERPISEAPIIELDDAGFTLFPPTMFFQTIKGEPSFPDIDQCQQCAREYVGQQGSQGCNLGYYCNEAALCAPCNLDNRCGPECAACDPTGSAPYCGEVNDTFTCVECRVNADCPPGFSCNPDTHVCNECNVDADCGRGETCVDHVCVDCATSDSCAGSSCNCCPPGANGEPMQCAPLAADGRPMCVECTGDADCPGQFCDLRVGQCVDKRPGRENAQSCGEQGVSCPAGFPYCLPGTLGTACAECRSDLDCADGNFCMSGYCTPCTRDKHCGPRCTSCGGDTPFCSDAQTPELAECVRCVDDSQCGGGTCNPDTNDCEPACAVSCGDDTPYCLGALCVECFADTQCPCGGTCDPATNTCSDSCKSNTDCVGAKHCRWASDGTSRECALGPMPSDSHCGSTLATACSGNVGRAGQPAGAWLLALAALALLVRRRRRGGP